MDILIRNARVHDGEHFLPDQTDVGISGGAVVLLRSGERAGADEVIDASGLTLAPAFIDVHNHGDLRLLSRNGVNALSQGVGTVIVGNCGFSPWGPCAANAIFLDDDAPFRFGTAKEYFETLDRTPLPVNVASLTGLSALLGEDGMCERLDDAMKAGCIGLSVGLAYEGQNRIDTPSLIDLTGVLSSYADRWSGVCWHMRDQSEHLLKAVAEVVRVHEATGAPCHISHLKRTGLEHPEDLDAALEMIRPYPDITADMYPYVEAWTLLAFPISTGAETLGKSATTEDLAMAGCRKLCPNLWADIVLVSGVADDLLGKSVEDVGEMFGEDGLATFMRLHEEYPDATACYMNQSHPSNIEAVLKCKETLVASDGHIYGTDERGHHPRSFGTFSRFFARCRDHQWMSQEQAIRKMTSLPAKRFSLAGRGRILPGYHADLCLFRADRFGDTATFECPGALSEGMEMVLVNGEKAYANGQVVSKNGVLLHAS